MFSLKNYFRKEDRFFVLLQASANEGRASVKHLNDLVTKPGERNSFTQLLETRGKELQISEEIDTLLCESYVTPMDREDIEMLARALYRVPKSVKKFAERYLLCEDQLPEVSFAQHLSMLDTATETICRMVAEINKGHSLASTKAHNDLLQRIEGDADKLLVHELEHLFQGRYPVVQTVILKDLHELMEKVFDRCRNAGNLMFQIVLKNS